MWLFPRAGAQRGQGPMAPALGSSGGATAALGAPIPQLGRGVAGAWASPLHPHSSVSHLPSTLLRRLGLAPRVWAPLGSLSTGPPGGRAAATVRFSRDLGPLSAQGQCLLGLGFGWGPGEGTRVRGRWRLCPGMSGLRASQDQAVRAERSHRPRWALGAADPGDLPCPSLTDPSAPLAGQAGDGDRGWGPGAGGWREGW